MKKILILLITLISLNAYAQEEFAKPGPLGIFVYLGNDIPNGKKISAINIERKTGNNDFKKIAEVKSASTLKEFISKAKDNAKYFSDFAFPPDSTLEIIWNKSQKYGLMDSIYVWGFHPAVRLALGLLYYDTDAKENTEYQYRNNNLISNPASYPIHPEFDTVFLKEYYYKKDNGLLVQLYSVGNNPALSFKLYKYNKKGIPEEVEGERSMYRVGDSVFYTFKDKNISELTICQYSFIGVDYNGNMSIGSLPFLINLQDFGSVYFIKTKATKSDDFLGIDLNWKLNDISNVASIHIFRSNYFDRDFKELGIVRAEDTLFSDQNIEPDKIYYYYLTIKDATGTQSKKSGTFFDFGFDKRKPLTPVISEAVPLKNGIKLEIYVPDEFIAGYRVFRSENGNEQFVVINDLVSIEANDSNYYEYYDTGNTMSGKVFYNYVIESENTSHIKSDKSNRVQSRPDMSANISSPSDFQAYFQDSVINLYWDDIKSRDYMVAGYRLFKREKDKGDFISVLPEDSILEGNRYIDINYKEGITYEYKIVSIDIGGYQSSSGSMAYVYVDMILPPSPAINAAVNLPDGVLLEWSMPNINNLKNYELYRYERGEEPILISQPDDNATSFLDKTATNGKLYFYFMKTVDKSGLKSNESEEVGIRH